MKSKNRAGRKPGIPNVAYTTRLAVDVLTDLRAYCHRTRRTHRDVIENGVRKEIKSAGER